MTRPTVIYFGPDGSSPTSLRSDREDPNPKIYLRTLLYATAKRGRIIESMFVRLRRGESTQNFNIWVYGDTSLARGSGLYVGENGIAANHHFLLPKDGTTFQFLPGEYTLEVFASLVGDRRTLRLSTIRLVLDQTMAERLQVPGFGVYFDWGPDSRSYHPQARVREQIKLPDFLLGRGQRADPHSEEASAQAV